MKGVEGAKHPASLVDTVNGSGVAMLLADLATRQILAASPGACHLIGIPLEELVGRQIADVTHPDDQQNLSEALDDLARSVIDSYQATRRYIRPSGEVFSVSEWTRRLRVGDRDYALNLVRETAADDILAPADLAVPSRPLGLVVTDHDWRIDRSSVDAAALLGAPSGQLRGTGVLGLLAPTDVPEFLSAASRAGREDSAFTVRIRTSVAPESRALRAVVLALCPHDPARLGIVLSEPDADEPCHSMTLRREVAATVEDARAVGIMRAMERLESARGGVPLSERQWEMVGRVARGESVNAIAAATYLSPSTVRNHLTVVYRKLGVHSKGELLALLLQYAGDSPMAAP